jgi:Lambda phage tail tube protein, TTP
MHNVMVFVGGMAWHHIAALVSVVSFLASLPFILGTIAAAQPAINTLLKIANEGSPILYNTIANVGDLTGPTMMAKVVDVTSHSTGSPWTEKITTLLDGGDITLPLFFVPSSPGSDGQANTPFGHDGTNGLLSVFTQRQLRNYSITFPDAAATTYYFEGYVSKFSMKAAVAGVLTADVTFTITGEPTLV